MEKIIKAAIDRGASDLHIKAGDVFRARIDGKLVAMTKQALSPEQTRAIALRLINNEKVRERIDQLNDYDCSWGAPGIGRFRVNILRQRSSFMIVMRVIPFKVPGVGDLALPPVYERIAETERGMVLVTGVTGSGKSSSLAAMMRHINETMEKHIVTLEEPIEFLHRDVRSSITQREIGTDTENFRTGLRAALRQDPDVIVLGELRDSETIDTGMKAAETGHLLLSTLHTPDAQTTIMRMISMFPPEEHDGVRLRLAESLHAVISQRLLPRMDGKGRVAACEIMIVTPTIRDLILQQRIGEIRDFIADGREQYGMQTFDQHLADLVTQGVVAFDTALAASTQPADFELKMNMFRQGSGDASSLYEGVVGRKKLMARRFGGVMGPMVTPFKADESLDLEGYEFNVRAHLAAGLDGVLVAGSTGEAALLSDDERRTLTEVARSIVPADRTLLVGTGAESTRHCIQRCRDAASSGADAVLVVAPHYYSSSMTPSALKAHYLRVADESPVPVLLYNIPKYAHFRLEPELIADLSTTHENIRGMKDSAGDMTYFARYIESQSDTFDVMTGHGGTFATALSLGARGGILAVALFAAELAVEVWQAHGDRRTADAEAAQKPLVPMAAEIVARMGVPGVKAAMERVGLRGGRVRLPLLSPPPGDLAQLEDLLRPLAAVSRSS